MTVSTPQGVDPPIGIASMEVPHPLPSPTASSQSEVHSNNNDEAELLSVSWNQDYGCFVAATSYSFHIYNCEPFGEILRRIFENGGFRIVELLFRCNYFALVGDGANPLFPPNSVMIWDDRRGCCKGELRFRSNVRAVKLRDGYIVVVLEHSILLYRFIDLKLIRIFETSTNPRGLCCLSHYSNSFLLACPGLQEGQVRVEHFDLKTLTLISAHDSHIACLSLTLDGLLLATASTKGTLIRIFNTKDGNCVQEVRRGRDRADIYNIAFSPNMQWLAVSSDKGTVHVFSLKVQGVSEDASRQNVSGIGPGMVHQNSLTSQAALISPNTGVNRCSSLSFMKGVLPKYFSSEWSFAKFHLPEATRHIAAFGAQNTIVIVSMDGSFYRCSFDTLNGGEMVQQECIRFLKSQQQS